MKKTKTATKKLLLLNVLLVLLLVFATIPVFAQNQISKEVTTNEIVDNQANFNRVFSHRMASVNGVRLHYVIGGKGEPVVLLHGWPTTWYEWRRIMPALSQQYTVIAPDTRGLGDSSRPKTGYDKRTLAEDIYQLVQQLGFQQINLIGHDLGAQIAFAYANEHPKNIRKLVLMDVPIPGLTNWEQAKQNWHFPFHATNDLPEAMVEGKERLYISWFYSNFAYNPAAFTAQDIDEYNRTYSAPGTMRAGFEYYRAFSEDERQNQEYVKRKLQMPILTIGGEAGTKDLLIRQIQPVAVNTRGVVMEKCGHWLSTECPNRVTQELLTFLR